MAISKSFWLSAAAFLAVSYAPVANALTCTADDNRLCSYFGDNNATCVDSVCQCDEELYFLGDSGSCMSNACADLIPECDEGEQCFQNSSGITYCSSDHGLFCYENSDCTDVTGVEATYICVEQECVIESSCEDLIEASGFDYEVYKNHYYVHLTNDITNESPLTYAEASGYLEAAPVIGAHILTINDADEQEWVENTFLTGEYNDQPFWLGLSDELVEGVFISGTRDIMNGGTFQNWQGGEPNNYEGGEDYSQINWHYNRGWGDFGKWNDIDAESPAELIIEFPGCFCDWDIFSDSEFGVTTYQKSEMDNGMGSMFSDEIGSEVDGEMDSEMDSSMEMFPAEIGGYATIDQEVNYEYAQSIAGMFGGYLVSIESPEEQSFVESIIEDIDGQDNIFWLGANDMKVEGTFEWASGEEFGIYTNWNGASYEPNNYNNEEDASAINWHYASEEPGATQYAWNDIDQNNEYSSILEFDYCPYVCYAEYVHEYHSYIGFGDVKVTLGEATMLAEYMGGEVLVINSQEEQDFIADKYLDEETVLWLGITDYEYETLFTDSYGRLDYTNWNAGEPNAYNGSDEDYVVMNEHYAMGWDTEMGTWNDVVTDNKYGFVIEIPHLCFIQESGNGGWGFYLVIGAGATAVGAAGFFIARRRKAQKVGGVLPDVNGTMSPGRLNPNEHEQASLFATQV